MTRPRLILVPHITELEWVIKSELEQWAEVAAFDMPGVGAEPAAVPLDRQALVDRAVAELDGRGWDSYVLVCDGSSLPVGVRVAHARRNAVEAMALGHARLSNRMDSDRPPVNKEVTEAFGQLAESDPVADEVREVGRQGDEGRLLPRP